MGDLVREECWSCRQQGLVCMHDDGGSVSASGVLPRSSVAPEARFTDEQRAAVISAAVVAGLVEQARRHPGFHCDKTSNRDMFAVSGILTVSELVESVTKALRGDGG